MITIRSSGSFKHTESFLKAMPKIPAATMAVMNVIGKQGVEALRIATPRDSGLAANSWGYRTGQKDGKIFLIFTNNDIEKGFPVAIMLQYGYGTGTGGYVQGQDYINPATKRIFDDIRDRVWKEVTLA